MDIIQRLENSQIQKLTAHNPVPEFAPGDTLRVLVKVIEGDRERTQAFEGVCIARKHSGVNSAFTVRKISYGEGVERLFPLYSPNIRVELVRRGRVRRAKLYYLRERQGKSARIAEKTEYGKQASGAAETPSAEKAPPVETAPPEPKAKSPAQTAPQTDPAADASKSE